MDIKNIYDAVIFTSAALTIKDALYEAIKAKIYLRGANLSGANERGANLSGAYLHGANLSDANLRDSVGAEQALAMIQFIPETGSFEAWKKCSDGAIVHLLIPADAKRSHGSSRKCRASKAQTIEIFDKSGNEISEASSGGGYGVVTYRKGETVEPINGWDEDRWNVCSAGIHFFLMKIEAENYLL